jgi:hypothetical protein
MYAQNRWQVLATGHGCHRIAWGRQGAADATAGDQPSTHRLADIDVLICGRSIECRFPNRDLAVAHGSDLNAKSLHALTGASIFLFSVPNVRHDIVHQRAKLLSEPIPLLLGTSGHKELAKRVAPSEFRDNAEPHNAVFCEASDVPGREQRLNVGNSALA